MTLVFGGLSFPLVAVGDKIPQPFTDAALPYFKSTINAYVGTAFAATFKGKISGQAATLACQATGISNPDLQAHKMAVQLPYLALWAEDGQASEGTMRWDNVETKYALEYVLPPLPFDTIQNVATPLLQAVQKLLVLLIKAGTDPSHSAGAMVWEQAGIVSVRMGRWQIVADNLGNDGPTAQAFPILQAEIFVVEQEGYDPGGVSLTRVDSAFDHASGDGIYPDAVNTRFTPTLETPRVVRALENTMQLRFFAVEGAHAFSPPAVRIGRVLPIGKTRHDDGSYTIDPGPAVVTLDDEHAPADATFLRGEVIGGRIKCADSATARALDVPFTAEPKRVDTLTPPALDEATTKDALNKRSEK